jgi:hypothetical protein
VRARKKGSAGIGDAPVFAGDPAPQQLTAPCRKYSGRLHHPIEQGTYRDFQAVFSAFIAVEPTNSSWRLQI